MHLSSVPLRIFSLDIGKRQIADVLGPAPDAQPAGDPHHGADALRVFPQIDRLAECQPGVEVVQRDGGPGKCLDQRNLDRRELVVAAEISLDGDNEPIELLRGVGATVEQVSREQLRPGFAGGMLSQASDDASLRLRAAELWPIPGHLPCGF